MSSTFRLSPSSLESRLDNEEVVLEWEETELYQKWNKRTSGDNDFLIVISPSSKTSGSGSGKTTFGTRLGKLCDRSESGFDAEKQASLDAGDLAYNVIPKAEKGSAIVFDEAQGAPGTKSVNARRGMTSEALDAINGLLANRDKNLTIIIIVQQLGMLDNLIYPMVDAWLLITEDPQSHKGAQAVHHSLTMNDYDLNNPDIKTPAHETLTWDALPKSDPDYQAMEEKKQDAKRRQSDEGTPVTELPKPLRDKKIRRMAELGIKQSDIADTFDLKQPTISRIINEE